MKLLFLSIFTTLLFAQNPNVYSALGNEIYANVENIKNLRYIPEFQHYEKRINKYIQDVIKIKEEGFVVRSQEDNVSKDRYLNKLRKLSIINNSFIKYAEDGFKEAIKKENNELFLSMVNSGLIDTEEHKKEIVEYYLKHDAELDSYGIIQTFLDEKKVKKNIKKEYIEVIRSSKKEIDAARIQRIRKRDKAKEAAMIKSLEEEVIQKKINIRENQKKELSID